MIVKHIKLALESDLEEVIKDALSSKANLFLFHCFWVKIPENAIEELSKQINGDIQCVSAWCPSEYGVYNMFKLIGDSTVQPIGKPIQSLSIVDYCTFECLMVSRKILEKIIVVRNVKKALKFPDGGIVPIGVMWDFFNQVYEMGYNVYANGDVICKHIPQPALKEINDPPKKVIESDEIKVAIVTDNNYVIGASVVIKSIIDNYADKRKLKIIIGDTGISEENKKKLSLIYKNTEFITIPKDALNDLKTTLNYHTPSIFGRLLLPSLIKEKFIYLDCDIIVRGNIADLYDIDVSNYAIGAIQDYGVKERNGICYFNSGVLLINPSKWGDLTEKCLEYHSTYQGNFGDQDALNDVLKGNFLQISGKWNRPPYIKTKRKTNIVHFVGSNKAWWDNSILKEKGEFSDILNSTPFAGWKPQIPKEELIII